jgi:prepilin signal peptidase PulO-like enzyme (type II secretory pathway)
MILPDFGIGVMVVCVMVLVVFGRPQGSPVQHIFSAMIGFGFMLLLHLITKGKGMGMGDVKLAVFMGLFLGFPKIIVSFYVAFIVGAIYGILMMLRRKYNKKSVMPFGPFLILGTVAAWWWGEVIIKILETRF